MFVHGFVGGCAPIRYTMEIMVQLVGSGLSFHHVDPGDGTQVVQLGGRLLSLLNYLDFMCVSVFIMGSAH